MILSHIGSVQQLFLQLGLDALLLRNLTKRGRLPGIAGKQMSHSRVKIQNAWASLNGEACIN